jgi:TIR domain
MAYLKPHFEYDVFVSYSRGDPSHTGDSPLMRWTASLIRELKAEIQSVDTEFDQLHVWHDEKIDPTAGLTDELRRTVKSSGILMIVMSPRYLASSWCKDELDWFREQVRDRSNEQGRVFVVRAVATEEKDWPDFLRDERGNSQIGFLFHDPLNKMPYGWRDIGEKSEDYVRQLWTLQTALTKRLREIRDRQESRAKLQSQSFAMPLSFAPLAFASPPLAPRRKRVYVHASGNQRPARDAVQRKLKELGIAPLSAAVYTSDDLSDWNREDKVRFEAAKRCDALALLRADDSETFIGDLIDIGVDECGRIQSAQGLPLPCAVLDQSGTPLPIDIAGYGIERFDLAQDDWQSKFGAWLERGGARNAEAP